MQIRRIAPFVPALVALLLAGSAHAGDDAGTESLAEHLRTTKISLMVEEMSFGDVIDVLRTQTGLNILIDPRIRADIGDAPVVALHVDDIALETVLDLLKHSGGEAVVWYVEGDVVVFTAHELVPRRLEVRIYPVAELVAPRTIFTPPPAGLLADSGSRREEGKVRRYGGADELIELVQGAVEPTYWEETEGADIRTLGEGRLVANASPQVHDAILAFLAGLENRGPDALRVEIHVVDAGTLPPEVARTETDVALRDETASALLGGRETGAFPSFCMAVRDGVSSTAFSGTRRAYVAAYEPRFAGGATTPDPRVDTQELGVAVRVRATTGGDDGRILLELGIAVADAGDTPASSPTEEPPIELPGVVRTRRESTLLVTPGRWHLAEGSTGGADAATRAALVRVTPLDPERQGPPSSTPFTVPTSSPDTRTELADVHIAQVRWEQADLDHIVAYLRTISGLNFFVTPRVRAEVFDEVSITLDLTDVSLRTVLDLVTEPYELRWILKDDVVMIDRPVDRGPNMALRYFDVKDLVGGGVGARSSGTRRVTDRERAPLRLYDTDALVDLMRESIGRYDTWDDPAAIEARNGMLIVRNEPHVLDAVQWLLKSLRASVGVVVTTVDQVVVGSSTAAALAATEPGGGCPWLLEPSQLAAIEAAIAAGTAQRLGRERIISVQGSDTPKTSGEEFRYVADYDVRSEDVSVPVRRVETLHSGAAMRVRTTPGHPGSPVYVELEYERSVLSSMRPFSTPHGPIDLPVTDVWRVATGLRVPDGRTVVVTASRRGDRVRLLLATPKRTPLRD